MNRSPGALPTRAVFVDFHGVLCTQPFWASVLEDSSHPLRPSLMTATEQMFAGEPEMMSAWMRGQLRSEQICEHLVALGAACEADELLALLQRDCASMRLTEQLAERLRGLTGILRVLATDNMDCLTAAAPTALTETIDEIINSSLVGVLKAEAPELFFAPTLARHGIAASEALLLDDSEANCRAFASIGGQARVVRHRSQAVALLDAWLAA